MAKTLNQIEHIVVLMLENRSFDNMLGWQFGLDPKYFNLSDQGEPIHVWGKRDAKEGYATMTIPDPDPGELFTDMNYQLQTPVEARPHVRAKLTAFLGRRAGED